MQNLPEHLRKYIVDQNYEKYSPMDHACWRFILRQLKSYLSRHGHPSYLEGLEKTGIDTERIPRIEDISKKLEAFGWRALPVSGFIPPAAFMELQSLSVLPIASDMRSLDHLLYTPAPDIVHEAAGHAPLLIEPEFAKYLKQYAQVAKRAIVSSEDLAVYEAIRRLSDLKENPSASPADIEVAQKHLDQTTRNISHISEAAELARMNWWTAEYGLIGSLESPKIYGAGLLSSVGESQWCLSAVVKKIPFSLDCIKTGYDITEPQPQLFVVSEFSELSQVLQQMADQMAFRTGGSHGLEKALKSGAVNSYELNSGIQISGKLDEVLYNQKKEPIYLRLSGPSQLCFEETEIPTHGKSYHSHGFGSPVGILKNANDRCLSDMSPEDILALGLQIGRNVKLEFKSGIVVNGILVDETRLKNKLLILKFKDCEVRLGDRILFEKAWGFFDMAVGSTVTSVFGGPADHAKYGEIEDFVALRVPERSLRNNELVQARAYSQIRNWRERDEQIPDPKGLLDQHFHSFPSDWLLQLEAFEILAKTKKHASLAKEIKDRLQLQAKAQTQNQRIIEEGISLAEGF